MGKDADTAGPAARDDTNRKRGTAALVAALWPSLLGPEHGDAWRVQNRRIWRRRLANAALIAGILGVSTLAAAPPFHPAGADDAPQDLQGRRERAGHGPGGQDDAHGPGQGAQRLLITFRELHDHAPTTETEPVGPAETVGDHLVDAVQGPDDHGLQQPWRSAPIAWASGHGFGGANGGGGVGGAGGAGGGGGGSAPGGPQGDGPPGPQTGAGPAWPTTLDEPPFVVDPDQGPHQSDDDPKWPPKDWPPKVDSPQRTLSPIPEPQTWLMMIAGFAAVGASLRRGRRKHHAHAASLTF